MSITRSKEEVALSNAKELLRIESYDDALRVLRPLWRKMSYRTEGWWDIVQDVDWALRKAATEMGDGEAILWADWELMSSTFQHKPEWRYDLAQALDDVKISEKPSVVVREEDVHSFLSASFAFEFPDAKVADTCKCQLTITSHANKQSAPLSFSNISLAFQGPLKPVSIHHQPNSEASQSNFCRISLIEQQSQHDDSSNSASTMLQGNQDLTLTPGHTKVFEFSLPLREAGPARATSATFSIANDSFNLDYVVSFDQLVIPDMWWIRDTSRQKLVRLDPYTIDIKPKPPKMEIRFVQLYEQYYTDETIDLQLDVTNGEEEDCDAHLNVYIAGEESPAIRLEQHTNSTTSDIPTTEDGSKQSEAGISFGNLPSKQNTLIHVSIPASTISTAYDLMVNLTYHIQSDPTTQINKTMSIRLFVVPPFEANYDFAPRHDPAPWPSYFEHQSLQNSDDIPDAQKATGIIQKWTLAARYASFALTPLLITNISLVPSTSSPTIQTTISPSSESDPGVQPSADPTLSNPIEISPSALLTHRFTIHTQKPSLDDRTPTSADLTLAISWRRFPSDPDIPPPVNTTYLLAPPLPVSSPEPRVLLSIRSHPSTTPARPIVILTYTIENPSMHFLSFACEMKPSDRFAFEGRKSGGVALVPLSRKDMEFVVVPKTESSGTGVVNEGDEEGLWIHPVFTVIDKHFQKVLRVWPGEGCRMEKGGAVGIHIPFKPVDVGIQFSDS